jgi:hypothetical protein
MTHSVEELKRRFHEAHDAATAAAESGRRRRDLEAAATEAYEELHRARALEAGFTDVIDYDTWLALTAKRTIELSRRVQERDEP